MYTKFKGIEVVAIASGLPAKAETLTELTNGLIDEKRAKRLVKATGFKKLRLSKHKELTSDYCVAAAEKIFKDLNFDRSKIDGFVFITQTMDYIVPATSHVMQERLKLSNDIVAIDVIQGCSGYVYGLYLGAMMISRGSCKNVIVCCGDVHNFEPKKAVNNNTSMIFGDAGTATLLTAGEGEIAFNIKTYGEKHQALICKRSGRRYPKISEYDPTATPELLKENDTFMDGLAIVEFSLNEVPSDINYLLKKENLKADEIGVFAVHQANKLIVNSLAEKFGVDYDKVPFYAAEIGNTSSASIPVFLSRLENRNEYDLSKSCLCGFGVGLSVAAAVCNLTNTKLLGSVEFE